MTNDEFNKLVSGEGLPDIDQSADILSAGKETNYFTDIQEKVKINKKIREEHSAKWNLRHGAKKEKIKAKYNQPVELSNPSEQKKTKQSRGYINREFLELSK